MTKRKVDPRSRILAERGLTQTRGGRIYQPDKAAPTNNEHLKTSKMKLLEMQHNKPIEELLMAGSLREVAIKLGIEKSTASKWIRKLQLRYSANTLPDCTECQEAKPSCLYGVCWKLVDAHCWDLMEIKKKEIEERRNKEEVGIA